MSMAFLNRRLDELAEVQSHEFRLIMGALAQHKRQFVAMEGSIGQMQGSIGQMQGSIGQMQQSIRDLQQSTGELQQSTGRLQQSISDIYQTLGQLSQISDLQQQALERHNAVAEERFALLRQALAEHEHDDPAA